MRRLIALCATLAVAVPTSMGVAAAASLATQPPMPAPPANVGGGATSSGADTSEQTALSGDQEQAASAGRSVMVDESSQTDSSVNPDGSTTVNLFASPQRVQRNGAWVDIDSTLVKNSDGSYSTVATDAATTFSGGGTADVATTSANGQSVGVGLGITLPKPTVAGSAATYANVMPNTDLVVTANDGGFEYALVIKKRPSSAPSYTLPLSSHGLSFVQDPATGAISMTNSAGKTVFASSVPIMYGSTLDPHSSLPTRSEPLTTSLIQTAKGTALKVTPDWSFLSDPAVAYPVVIDPDATESVADFDFTSSMFPATQYYDNTITENGSTGIVHVGTYNSGSDVNRGYFSFPTGLIANHTINSADLYLKEVWAYSCTAEQVDVHEQASNFASSLTWNNQPSLGPTVASATVAKGYSSSCPAGNVDFNATSLARDWASAGGGQKAIAVTATNTTNNLYWKKFEGGSAKVTVTYANTPTAPTSLAVTPNNGSITASWAAPTSNGGAAITGYTVKYDPTSGSTITHSLGASARSDAASGLSNGVAYTVTVTASNSEGAGPAASASATPSTYPGAVTNLALGGGNNRVLASWNVPAANGGLPVTGYIAYLYPAGSSYPSANWISYKFVTGTSTSIQAGDGSVCNGGGTCPPANGTAYNVEVFPYNGSNDQITGQGAGYGPGKVSPAATAQNIPTAPQNLTTSGADHSVTVSWTAPLNSGGPGISLNGYVVYVYPSGATYPAAPTASAMVGAGTTSTTISGLSNGTSYMAYVWAGNNSIEQTTTDGSTTAAGYGPAAKSSFSAAAGLPGTPGNVSADKTDSNGSPVNDGFIVSWDSPSGNGATITAYRVRTYLCTSTNPSSCTLDPLHPTVTVSPNGQTGRQHAAVISAVHLGYYAFDVAADNTTAGNPSTGQGAWSPMTQPQSNYGIPLFGPGGVTATPNGSRTATVTFSPGAADAAAFAVTSYTVTGYTASDNVVRARISTTIPAGTLPGGTPTNPTYQVTVSNVVNGVPVYWVVKATESVTVLGSPITFGTATSSPSNTVTTAGAPFAPMNAVAETTDTSAHQASVNWTAPASRMVDANDYAVTPGNNGSPITSYTASASPGNQNASTSDGVTTHVLVDGLTDGTSYTFTVTATNAIGTGPASAASNPATPSGQPFAPSAPVHTVNHPEDGQATLSWNPPSVQGDGTPGDNGAPITGYTLTASPGGATVTVSDTTAVFTGLTDGTTYTFTVAATNSKGTGQPSAPSAPLLVAGPPAPPGDLQALADNHSISITWQPSQTHGTPVTDYHLMVDPGDTDQLLDPASVCSGSVCSYTINGLDAGTDYDVMLAADSIAGRSDWADTDLSSPSNVPDAPFNVTAGAGDSSAIVYWSTPNSYGSPISHYTVVSDPGNVTVTTTSRRVTVPGLTNGTSYTFTVTATNDLGDSAPSAPSNAVTPAVYQGSAGTRTEGGPPDDSAWTVAGLGDSYASGEGNAPFEGVSATDGCHRSEESWESYVDDFAFLNGPFDYVACSGATTDNILGTPPSHDGDTDGGQVSVLSSSDNAVLLTAGGDDVGFKDTLTSCVEKAFVLAHCTSDLDQSHDNIQALQDSNALRDLYSRIANDAPNAAIVVTNYPEIFRGYTDPSYQLTQDCEHAGDLYLSDEDYMRELWSEMNGVIAQQAAAAGAANLQVVDVENAFAGHLLCQPSPDVHGVHVYTSKASSFHPDNGGAIAVAQVVSSQLHFDHPTVTSVTPTNGPSGTTVDVRGTHFAAGSLTRVYFGGVPATGVYIASDTEIQVTAPPNATGTVDVVVQTSDGFNRGTSPVTSADQYTY